MASVDENNTRFFRTLLILIKEGRNVLLYLFRHRIYASGDIEKFLKENESCLKELKKKRVISYGQWTKLFPKPQEDNWDIGLIILLLQNICGIHVSSTEKNSIAAYLKRLREIRNEVQGHIVEPSISAEMFIDLCSELSIILKALISSVPGSDTFVHESEKRINEYLETSLDPKQFQILKDEIQDVSTMLMWLSDRLDASTNKILDEIKAKENVTSVHRVYLKDQEAQTNETMIVQFSDLNYANEAKVRTSFQTEKREERVLLECGTMAKPHLSSKHTQTEINIANPIPQNMKATFDESNGALLNSSKGIKVRLPCKHYYDIDALDSLVKFEINDGQKKLRCLRSNCCQTLDMLEIAIILQWSLQVFNHYTDKLKCNRLGKKRMSTALTDVITEQLEDTDSVSPYQLIQDTRFLIGKSVSQCCLDFSRKRLSRTTPLLLCDSLGSPQKSNECICEFLKESLSFKDNDILDCCCSIMPFT